MDGDYTIVLFREGGEAAGVDRVLGCYHSPTTARAFFEDKVRQHPGRLIMLCDRARVLARNDRSETTSWTRVVAFELGATSVTEGRIK